MVIKDYGTELQNRTIMQKIVGILKCIWKQVNIFDIPRLTREISSDVKLIRDRYDETIKAIDEYKNKLYLWFYRAKGGSNIIFNIIIKMLYI